MAIPQNTGNENGNNLIFGKQVKQVSFADFGCGWEATGTHDDQMLKEIYNMLKEKFKGGQHDNK